MNNVTTTEKPCQHIFDKNAVLFNFCELIKLVDRVMDNHQKALSKKDVELRFKAAEVFKNNEFN